MKCIAEQSLTVVDNTEYAFALTEHPDAGNIAVTVGNVKLKMMIDSGTTSNIVDEQTWEWLKTQHIKCDSTSAHTDKKLYAFASNTSLQIKGTFTCTVQVGSREKKATFVVIHGNGVALLGNDTAIALGVLKIGVGVASVLNQAESLQIQYPEVFCGVGKLKNFNRAAH